VEDGQADGITEAQSTDCTDVLQFPPYLINYGGTIYIVPTMPKKLSILIPVYNEQSYIRRIVERVIAQNIPGIDEKELVIVNDASTDRTPAVLEQLQTEYPEIRLFHQTKNQGKGAAIARAVQECTGDIALFQDADLEYDPADYPALLRPILEGRADVVYGSRFIIRDMKRVVFYHHKLGNMFLTHLSNWTTGLDLTDMETCYKVFRTELLKSIPIRSNRFGIEPEITAKISRRNAVVYEVPISYHGRSYLEGKKIGWKDGVSAIATILKYTFIDDCYTEECGHSVLNSMQNVHRYTKWMTNLASPFLGSRILEIGSGIGTVAKYLPQRETLMLTDKDAAAVKTLLNHYDGNQTVKICQLDAESEEQVSALSNAEKFDSVVMFSVLEHIEDDVQALKNVQQLLEPKGRLILVLPQHPWLYGTIDTTVGHYRRYTKREIKEKMRTAGYRITVCRSFNALSIPGWYINFVLLRRKKMNKFQLKFYNMLIPFMSFIERFLPLPGANLFIVAENNETPENENNVSGI